MKEGSPISHYIYSVGMKGLAGQVIRIEATVREDKEECAIIELPDASIRNRKSGS